MQKQLVASSNVRSIGYDLMSEILEVEFLNGSTYQYYGVPRVLYDEIMRATSKGIFLNMYIKNRYAYSRIG